MLLGRNINNVSEDVSSLSSELKNIGSKDVLALDSYVDINTFLDVLYELLKETGLTLRSDEDPDANPGKFFYTEEYPDEDANNSRLVTYEIAKRAPASLGKDKSPFSGRSNYKAMLRTDSVINPNGGVDNLYYSQWDNRIRFICWSPKSRDVRELASTVEGFLSKFYQRLKQFVPVLVIEGRDNSINLDSYGYKRFRKVSIDIFVRTNEKFVLSEKDIELFEKVIKVKN